MATLKIHKNQINVNHYAVIDHIPQNAEIINEVHQFDTKRQAIKYFKSQHGRFIVNIIDKDGNTSPYIDDLLYGDDPMLFLPVDGLIEQDN